MDIKMKVALRNVQDAKSKTSYNFLTNGGPVSRRKRDKAGDVERGARAKAIRELLGQSQYDIVELLNATAKRLGFDSTYRYYTVSRIERGSISFEDAAVYVAIDPQQRGWEYFVLGAAKRADPALFQRVGGTKKRS